MSGIYLDSERPAYNGRSSIIYEPCSGIYHGARGPSWMVHRLRLTYLSTSIAHCAVFNIHDAGYTSLCRAINPTSRFPLHVQWLPRNAPSVLQCTIYLTSRQVHLNSCDVTVICSFTGN